MFTYSLRMGCLHPDTSCSLLCLVYLFILLLSYTKGIKLYT